MYKKIGDYGIIGNLLSAALVGRDGSLDWLCLPRLDSPSLFGALLDARKGGRFAVTPRGEYDSTAFYLRDANVLVTRFRTRTGIVRLFDFMPIGTAAEPPDGGRHRLYRLVEVEKGEVEVCMLFDPRFNYGRTPTELQLRGGGILARGEGETLTLSSTHPVRLVDAKAEGCWRLKEGEQVCLHLEYGAETPEEPQPEVTRRLLRETAEWWERWLHRCEACRLLEYGPHRELVVRSLLALKLLFYHPTGSIAAAATMSLPEEIGGERNWDYRYAWIRDASMTVDALWTLGYQEEMHAFVGWIEKIIAQGEGEELCIMYRLDGRRAPEEEVLSHWEGYKGSAPVRIGNEASRQRQLGIYGHLMEGARKLADSGEPITPGLWEKMKGFCNYVTTHWRDPDSSIWEMRGAPRHFLHTRLMCWVALRQGKEIAQMHDLPADLGRWEETMEEIREEILSKGWSDRLQAFIQALDAEDLDASNLLIPMMDFLPFDDPRVLANTDAIRRELGKDGFIHRYLTEDGLRGGEGIFLFCTFWLIVNLARQGDLEEAEFLLRKTEAAANHLGLFSEEYDPEWQEQLGNTPQAFTHIGYLQAVATLESVRRQGGRPPAEAPLILNGGQPSASLPSGEIPGRLIALLEDIGRHLPPDGNLDLEALRSAELSQDWLDLERSLPRFDPRRLEGQQERLAFWTGIHNLLVLRGILHLDIRRSVQEIGPFFRKVRYRVGDFDFSPEEIENGLLRGNRPAPGRLLPPLPPGDPRLMLGPRSLDPRIHFVLFRGTRSSASWAPLSWPDPDAELDGAAATCLAKGWILLDQNSFTAHLHRSFRWYADDFGHSSGAGARFLHRWLTDGETHAFLEENAGRIQIKYLPYDWRLPRSRSRFEGCA